MKRVSLKPVFFGTEIAIVAMFIFGGVSGFAVEPPPNDKENTSRAYFAESSAEDDDGFASSRTGSVSTPKSDSMKEQTEIEVADDPNNRPVTLEEMPDWQLMHSEELPFGDYFIDTRVVGAVRYHADFALDREYDILRELSNIQKDLSDYLAIPHPKETIEVFFFQSSDTYRKFLAIEFPEAPYDRTALYVKQDGPGMVLVFRSPDMKEDLRHEMTHAFLHAAMSYVPLWLDEGLAEYFEKPRETRAVDNPYFKSVLRKITFGQVPSVARLEKMKFFDQMGAAEYCDAWSWVHFMIHHSRETHQMLAGYMRLLAERGDKTPPLDPYLTKAAPDAKKAYVEHFRNWKNRHDYKAQSVAAQPKTTSAPTKVGSATKAGTATKDNATEKKDAAKSDAPEKERSGSRLTRGWSESFFR